MDPIATIELPTTEALAKIDKGNYVIEQKDFGKGANAGFSWYQIQVKTVEAAVERFGSDATTGLINRALAASQRTKAANRLAFETPAETKLEIERLKAAGQTVLLTEQEAEAYKPGEREMSSPASMLKEVSALRKEAQTVHKAGDTARAKVLLAEADALFKKAFELASQEVLVLD